MEKNQLDELLKTEDKQLQRLNEIVIRALEEESLVSQKLKEFEETSPSLSSRLADRVTRFGGSWKFILAFTFFMVLWMGVNVYLLTKPFDPYPFIFLNLVLSTIAALQAPLIMMSQNRKEQKDRQRAVNDYLVNVKAEVEIRNVHEKLDLLIAEQMKTLFEIQKAQMEMMEEIKESLNK
jgi:uncharacterized membrane protein